MSARFYLSDRHRVLMYADLMLLAAPRIPCRGHPSAAGSAESGAKTALELTIVGSGQACGGWFEICPGRLFETGCLADTPGMDDTYIADHYPCALGRLVGNLSSLEWVLRHVLYRYDLTLDCMNEQIARVGAAIDVAKARLRELTPQG